MGRFRRDSWEEGAYSANMLKQLRARTGAHRVLLALAIVALALKIMFPPGFMPGSSLAQPITICSGQEPGMVNMMMDDGHHQPSNGPHQSNDHPCAFAGHGAPPLTPDLRPVEIGAIAAVAAALTVGMAAVTPGRGMAAPPPPSHAPPALRT